MNIKNILIENWEKYSGEIYCDYSQKIWTSNELIHNTMNLFNCLKKKNIKKKDTIGIILPNTVCFPVVLFAFLKLKCNILVLPASISYYEFKKIYNNFNFKYFIYEKNLIDIKLTKKYTKIFSYQLHNINLILKKITTNITSPNFESTILHLTSGTNDIPKICIRSQQSLLNEARNCLSTIDIYNKANVIITTPLYHAFGFCFGLILSVISNSNISINKNLNIKKLLRSFNENSYDILLTAPSIIKLFIEYAKDTNNFSMAKNVFYAGSNCPKNIIELFEKKFKSTLYTIYGSTETGVISTNYTKNTKLEGVGEPIKNTFIQICNKYKYKDIDANIGEIYIKSNSLMDGYINVNQNYFNKESYFSLGDLGTYVNNLFIIGRTTDIINIDGLKVDPSEIEKIILKIPGISDVIVYSGMHNYTENILCTLSVSDSTISEAKIRKHCINYLSSYKIPRNFFFVKKLPKNDSGKILKNRLQGYKKHF